MTSSTVNNWITAIIFFAVGTTSEIGFRIVVISLFLLTSYRIHAAIVSAMKMINSLQHNPAYMNKESVP